MRGDKEKDTLLVLCNWPWRAGQRNAAMLLSKEAFFPGQVKRRKQPPSQDYLKVDVPRSRDHLQQTFLARQNKNYPRVFPGYLRVHGALWGTLSLSKLMSITLLLGIQHVGSWERDGGAKAKDSG